MQQSLLSVSEESKSPSLDYVNFVEESKSEFNADARLTHLKALYDYEVITDGEYKTRRSQIIGSLKCSDSIELDETSVSCDTVGYPEIRDELDILDDKFDRLKRYWDRTTIILNVLHHVYCYFLICYWWNTKVNKSSYLGGNLLIENVYFSVFYAFGALAALVESDIVNNCLVKLLLAILSGCQPFASILLYMNRGQYNDSFYFLMFANVFFHGLTVHLILCYYMLPHNRDTFVPDVVDKCLIICYFIIYFLNIIASYPSLQPLKSITLKHLLFKICSFSLQIIVALFTGYLMINYYFGDIKHEMYNDIVAYIYKFYLIKFFEITPILCIWIFFYTLDWNVMDEVTEMLNWYNLQRNWAILLCGSCYLVWWGLRAFCLYPFAIMLIMTVFVIYHWIIFECYIWNILESFVFIDSIFSFSDRNTKKYTTWQIIYEYLTDINDHIGYNERLCILHHLYTNTDDNDMRLLKALENIIIKQTMLNSNPCEKQGFLRLIMQRFLDFIKIHTERIHNDDLELFDIIDGDWLQCYDFQTRKFQFDCNQFHIIFMEIIGIFIIIPIFIVSTICATVVCPIILMYYYCDFMNKYSTNWIDYFMDYKLWILCIYMILLLMTATLFVDQCKLLEVWYHCNLLHFERIGRDLHENKVNHIQLYHNYFRDYRMIYNILHNFFGPLSFYIMQYLGMIKMDNSLHIPTMRECMQSKIRNKHKDSVVFDCYLFDINKNSINC